MAAPKHRIRVRDAAPADARIMAEIDFAAFGTDVIGQLIHPPPVKPEAVAKMAASFFPTESRKDPPNTETLLIVAELLPEDGREDGRGEVVAWAKWVLQREPLPEKVWNAEPVVTAEMLGEGTNLEVYNWFITELHRNLRQLVRGEAHLYLKALACVPNRQRMGAGSALVRWGTDLADKLGLVSWLEASPYGYPVYRLFGFEDVKVMDFKVTERWGVVKDESRNWGENNALELGGPLAAGSLRSVIMRRAPKGK